MPDAAAGDPFGIDRFPVSCLASNSARQIVFANAHAAAQLGRSRDALIGLGMDELLTPAARIFCDSYVYPILLAEGRCDEVALTVTTGSGGRAPVVVNVALHSDEPGIVLWSLLGAGKRDKLQEDVLASRNLLQEQTRALKQLATRDGLTGLLNRRASMDMIGQLVSSADRAAASVMILLLDVDRFKAINDTYGHDAGDEVLHQLGAAFAGMMRRHEIAGRYGGEEFIFALAAADAQSARPFSRRLHAAAQGVTGKGTPVTVSIGLCCRPPGSGRTLEDVVRVADQALYRAKALGRNRSMIGDDGAFLPFE